MQRVLDLDLDFFVDGVAHWREPDRGRLDADEYPAWSLDGTLNFLQTRCGLTERLPGFVVGDHGELFYRWRDAIDARVLERRSMSRTSTRTPTSASATSATCT